jgi:uncharacterized repeat protein (TIGR03847 family)
MSRSFDLEAPDHFTAGAVGPSGQRTFYLQGRESGILVTLKVEKEQVGALGEYLARLLTSLPEVREATSRDLDLLEPIHEAWVVGSIGVGYDRGGDRIVVEAKEALEEDSQEEPAAARFRITRAQAAAFSEQARALMKAGRPICPLCSRPKDADGHICPRSNGHVVR